MTDRLENAIDVLSTAYLQGELEAGVCQACAVGNMLQGQSEWRSMFYTSYQNGSPIRRIRHKRYWDKPEKLRDKLNTYFSKKYIHFSGKYDALMAAIDETGYSIHELSKIEYAFETAFGEAMIDMSNTPHKEREDRAQFKALMAVVDLLFEMEENINETEKEEAKAAFA